jgi:hypothetical protein
LAGGQTAPRIIDGELRANQDPPKPWQRRGRVTGLYGVAPTIEFVEIAQIVDNSGA